jgi:hypothetical protein
VDKKLKLKEFEKNRRKGCHAYFETILGVVKIISEHTRAPS